MFIVCVCVVAGRDRSRLRLWGEETRAVQCKAQAAATATARAATAPREGTPGAVSESERHRERGADLSKHLCALSYYLLCFFPVLVLV
jgi:hypothetical protein